MIKNDFLKHKQANINVKSRRFILPREWCHYDTETSAFNVNIRLLMFQHKMAHEMLSSLLVNHTRTI